MKDVNKTKEQLISELTELRNQITDYQQGINLHAVLTSIDDLVFFIDKNGIFNHYFKGSQQLGDLHVKSEAFIGKHFKDVFPTNVANSIQSTIDKINASGKSQEFDYSLKLNDMNQWFNAKLSPLKDESGGVQGITAVVRDITERKRMEETSRYMALHDSLTNLPNRELFNDRFNIALAHAQRHKRKVALMMLDIDRFKEINDTLGHDIGDKVLIEAGNRLLKLLRRSDTVARMGGDEFVLLVAELHKGEGAVIVADKIIKSFKRPFLTDGHELNITLSIGIAIYPDDVETIDALMKMADLAMYRVKKKGRNNYGRYAP